MLTWIRRWVYAIAVLGAFVVAAWWFVQQTSSYNALASLIRRHPVVAGQVGKVSSIRLPLFGYGLDVTDGRIDPDFGVRVSGSKGEASVRAAFVDGAISDAYLVTPDGHTIPLVVPR
jgi:hypothetical protein